MLSFKFLARGAAADSDLRGKTVVTLGFLYGGGAETLTLVTGTLGKICLPGANDGSPKTVDSVSSFFLGYR